MSNLEPAEITPFLARGLEGLRVLSVIPDNNSQAQEDAETFRV
jgi:hypothetical protein